MSIARWRWVLCLFVDKVMMSMHNACMFGAIASVHAWERVGAALCFIARRFLRIAVCRYVDDFFAPERSVLIWFCCELQNKKRCVAGPNV